MPRAGLLQPLGIEWADNNSSHATAIAVSRLVTLGSFGSAKAGRFVCDPAEAGTLRLP
jgi:hypothetical protein